MSDVVWTLDKTFTDPSGVEIRVLQRPLTDLVAAKHTELLPFFHERTLFQHRLSPAGQVQVTRGNLKGISLSGNRLTFTIQPDGALPLLTLDFALPWTAILTVWRVNDALDAVQFNVDSESRALYIQTGGERLFELTTLDDASQMPSGELRQALSLFSASILVGFAERG